MGGMSMFTKKDVPKPNQAQDKAEVKVAEQTAEVKVGPARVAVKSEGKTGFSQREAVFLAVTRCLEKNNVKFTSGKAADLLNPEMRKELTDALCADFKSGKVSLRETPAN